MKTRRIPARRLLLGRSRAFAQSWVLVAGAVALAGLVAGSLLMHRYDSLCRQRVQLEVDLAEARHELVRARTAYAANSAYESVVRRARAELAMVESGPADQMFLALPGEHPSIESSNWFAGLARRVDRFANVRGVFAAEKAQR